MAKKEEPKKERPEKENPIANRSPWFPPDSALHRGAHEPSGTDEDEPAGRRFYTPHPDSRPNPAKP